MLAFKARYSGGSSSQCNILGWGAQCGALTPRSLGRTCEVVNTLLFVGRLPWGVGFDYTMSPPLLRIALWFLLYIFKCGKSFLLVFRSFQYTIAL